MAVTCLSRSECSDEGDALGSLGGIFWSFPQSRWPSEMRTRSVHCRPEGGSLLRARVIRGPCCSASQQPGLLGAPPGGVKLNPGELRLSSSCGQPFNETASQRTASPPGDMVTYDFHIS